MLGSSTYVCVMTCLRVTMPLLSSTCKPGEHGSILRKIKPLPRWTFCPQRP
jgi:hypothetical protein